MSDLNEQKVIFGENADLADYVARIESVRVYDVARVTSLDRARRLSDRLGANMNFASLCFVSSDAAFARLKDEVLADGRVDLAEAQHILTLLDESFTPSEPLARLMKLLRTAVGDGSVSETQSREIARTLGETLNLQMTTAEERRRFMY